ncbi:zinc finger protein 501-like [Siniperca chuatsi]|uniref:zinc finger protein 501-like n=1 Tax=Siniperca chuatsi TaxID=119488 RepID=UPI001CE08122|nr:zinc finger protein 501-like [Siniperca chuatsi]
MSRLQSLKLFINQRLTAAVEEIFGHFEKTITEYEEELGRRRRLLDVSSRPDPTLRSEGVQQLSVRTEEVPPEQQEWSPSLDQDPPELPHIKEEQEELWTSLEGEQLRGLEEADITEFPFAPVKSEEDDDDEEKPQSSQLHQSQTEENRPANEDETSNLLEAQTEDSNGWMETREPQSGLDALNNNVIINLLVSEEGCDNGTKSFTCSECHKGFNRKATLKRHMRCHTGEKPYSCSVCKRRFRWSGDVADHMRIHTGEKPYSCSVCNKSFAMRRILVTHMRCHTGEKPYSCSVCKKHFKWSGDLVTHMRSHTGEKPFMCSDCGKSFIKHGTLTRHMRVHTGERPYVCSFCRKGFCQKGDLTTHVRTHTGEKPFSCRVCKRNFSHSYRVKNHKCVVESSGQ